MPSKPVATRFPGHEHPEEARAPALTIHCRHKCQVEDLPDQHLHEANLQGKDKNSTPGSSLLRSKGLSEASPCGPRGSRRAALGESGGWQSELLWSRTTKPDSFKAHLVHLLSVQMGSLRPRVGPALVQELMETEALRERGAVLPRRGTEYRVYGGTFMEGQHPKFPSWLSLCGPLRESPHLSNPQFPYLKNGPESPACKDASGIRSRSYMIPLSFSKSWLPHRKMGVTNSSFMGWLSKAQ